MIQQGTPEWFAQRLGKVTASRIADLMAKTKTGYSASRDNYKAQLVLERLTGTREESYTNDAMRWGTEQEPHARALYESKTGFLVDEVPMIDHQSIAMSGASPDGLVGTDGLVEIKCPNSATHLDYLLTKTVPKKYVLQMQWQMATTGRKWCDFVSYDPRMPERLQMWIVRVERDDALIAEVEAEVTKFLAEVSSDVAKLEVIEI
jgi:putative phage-type endonuclease